jgi:hypothetical protein
LGGAPLGGLNWGSVLSADGNGVEEVLEAEVVVALAEALVVAVTGSAVAPLEGARTMPGAVELPQPASTAASASTAKMSGSVFCLSMNVPEGSESAQPAIRSSTSASTSKLAWTSETSSYSSSVSINFNSRAASDSSTGTRTLGR